MNKDVNFQVNLQSPLNDVEDAGELKSDLPKPEKPAPLEKPKEKGLSKNKSSKGSSLASFVSLFSRKGKDNQEKQLHKKISLEEIPEEEIEKYIERFSNVAVSEKRKYGIPASIILANGIYQSAAGNSEIAKNANNHFHILCGNEWDGNMKDFDGQCFRKYESAWASFRGHSQFVSEKCRSLKGLPHSDYKSWAEGLSHLGFNDDRQLSKGLVRIIKKYNLDKYDL